MQTDVPLSTLLRESSRDQHTQAETSEFVVKLMKGELDLAAYALYVTQLAWLYDGLEARTTVGTPFPSSEILWDDALLRGPSLDHDLQHLGVENWKTSTVPTPAMTQYREHLAGLGDRSDFRLIAHHYTRYLGDLSGGQAIAALVARHYGAQENQLAFYDFSDVDNVVRFKETYRSGLDGLSLSANEVAILVDEVRLAFTFNQQVFGDLEASLHG